MDLESAGFVDKDSTEKSVPQSPNPGLSKPWLPASAYLPAEHIFLTASTVYCPYPRASDRKI